jgi:TolB protein
MMTSRSCLAAAVLVAATVAIGIAARQPPAQPTSPPQQQSDVSMTLRSNNPGLPPRIAVPPFIALTSDPETQTAARVIGEVLWDDLEFEREFYMIPRDTYRDIPQATSIDEAPLERWKELGADGVLIGSIQKTATGATVRFRLFNVPTGRSAMAKEYTGSPASLLNNEFRAYAHLIADDVHREQRALKGTARTKIAFTSDRDGDRLPGPIGDRGISNIYMSDYDGARPRRITISKAIDITPVWSPDARSIAFGSWRSGYQDIYILFPYGDGVLQNPTKGTAERQNFLPAFSPDGTKIAYTSTGDGNSEIYVMNRDGSNRLRLTNHPAIDVTPTWSPTGAQIAFTSDRTGTPQIYIVNADGTGLQQITRESACDRPTWSPAPLNEIAYSSRVGGGNIIRVFDFETRRTRALTDAIGSNESPAFSPNGRHVAFVSTRAGKEQIFTIHRDGSGLRQITRTGTNRFPNWSK